MGRLNLIAPINKTGYGVTGFNVLRVLQENEWDVSLFLKGKVDRPRDEITIIQQALASAQHFDYEAPCLQIWHQFDLAYSVGKKYFAWPIFELNRFTNIESHHLSYPDELIVCSEWAKNVLEENGIYSQCHVVPLGVDSAIFYPKESEEQPTVFMNVGKWEIRKGHDILVEAFNNEFSEDENVELRMMTYNPFLSQSETKKWDGLYTKSNLGLKGKIKIIDWKDTHHGVAKEMSKAHCGVFPSRAEGFNLELLEMMAMGKHVIATDYSGHTQFCNNDNSYLIPFNDYEDAFDGKWFNGQGQWMKFSNKEIKQLQEHMRSVHNEVQRGNLNNQDGIQTGLEFTWENSIKNYLEKVIT